MADSADDMILLAEVADAGSFTGGGKRLGMPKSTVSQRIAQLEARLGLRLLNRSTRHVSLTAAGQICADHGRRLRAEAEAAKAALGHLRTKPAGLLRITCPEVTASYFMPGFLHAFATAYPEIGTELLATNQHLDLIRDRVDFAFRVGTVTGQDLILRRLSAIRRIVVAAPTYLDAAPPLSDPADLSKHRCLVLETQQDWRFSSATGDYSLRPAAALRSDSMGFLLQSAVLGAGLALLPSYICKTALEAGQLVPVLTGWATTPSQLVLIMAHRSHQSQAQAAFHSFVAGYDFAPFADG